MLVPSPPLIPCPSHPSSCRGPWSFRKTDSPCFFHKFSQIIQPLGISLPLLTFPHQCEGLQKVPGGSCALAARQHRWSLEGQVGQAAGSEDLKWWVGQPCLDQPLTNPKMSKKRWIKGRNGDFTNRKRELSRQNKVIVWYYMILHQGKQCKFWTTMVAWRLRI